MLENGGFFAGKRVLVTGHTGFKGSWLSLWLHDLGARVIGLALPPEKGPSLYRALGLDSLIDSRVVDIQDAARTRRAILTARPQIVFHLAAQSLVRRSYREPGRTFATNVLGTLNVIQAAAGAGARVVVCATTDKCYEHPESGRAFVETDPLGGHDPYSASKACAEIVAASVRDSFLRGTRTSLSTVRAGNVIGGGDWAEDRLLPDCV
ncbi:MAG: CDP-glucose 4,6-dehydratase, partial [Elusimicrobia bacterium RBG_16_66_12]